MTRLDTRRAGAWWKRCRAALRAFEVQAILARTYALASRRRHAADGFDVCATTHCQLVDFERASRSRWRDIAAMAVNETRGQVLEFDSRPALTPSRRLWRSSKRRGRGVGRPRQSPIWRAVPTICPRASRTAHGGSASTARSFATRSPATAEPTPARTSCAWRFIRVTERDARRSLLITGERSPIVRGEEFRMVMARAFGVSVFPSSRFEVSQQGDEIVFDGTGFGHGVGLCQRGRWRARTPATRRRRSWIFIFRERPCATGSPNRGSARDNRRSTCAGAPRRSSLIVFSAILDRASGHGQPRPAAPPGEWRSYSGPQTGAKYSPLIRSTRQPSGS